MRIYPDHIYDPDRIKIAAELMQHEFRKLLPAVPPELWPKLDANIEDWFDGRVSELAAVHDFWNAADGIMRGFKLKGLVKYITAANVSWSREQIPVADIDITWALPSLASFGKPPYDTRKLKEAFAGDPALHQAQKETADFHAASSQPRNHYPVVSLADGERFKIGDGNRRTLHALVYDRPTIDAWVARGDLRVLRDYWVPTPFLRQLGEQAEVANTTGDKQLQEAAHKLLDSLFSQSVIARTNFDLRVKDKYPTL